MWPALVGGNFYLSYLVSVLMYVLVENPFNELGRFAIGVRRRGEIKGNGGGRKDDEEEEVEVLLDNGEGTRLGDAEL